MSYLTIKQVSRSGTAEIARLLASHGVLKIRTREGRPTKHFNIESLKLVSEREKVNEIRISEFKQKCCSILSAVEVGESVLVARMGRKDKEEKDLFKLTRVEVE